MWNVSSLTEIRFVSFLRGSVCYSANKCSADLHLANSCQQALSYNLHIRSYRVCSQRPCWRSKTRKNIYMKMKFISLRDIVLLCYSSNMAAANILYKFKTCYCLPQASFSKRGQVQIFSYIIYFDSHAKKKKTHFHMNGLAPGRPRFHIGHILAVK